jgi:uncharacterized protein YdhG (YjbR/CyaY superfamily)
MKSTAKSVDDYFQEVPEARLDVMKKLRELAKKYLPNHEENMKYNMPSYVRNNQVEVAFASQKQHLTVYFLIHHVMLDNKDKLKGLNTGKGCIRYSNPKAIDFDLMIHLLKETDQSNDRICI